MEIALLADFVKANFTSTTLFVLVVLILSEFIDVKGEKCDGNKISLWSKMKVTVAGWVNDLSKSKTVVGKLISMFAKVIAYLWICSLVMGWAGNYTLDEGLSYWLTICALLIIPIALGSTVFYSRRFAWTVALPIQVLLTCSVVYAYYGIAGLHVELLRRLGVGGGIPIEISIREMEGEPCKLSILGYLLSSDNEEVSVYLPSQNSVLEVLASDICVSSRKLGEPSLLPGSSLSDGGKLKANDSRGGS
jgi:hypothetical protein